MEAYLDNSATTVCCKAAADKMMELLTAEYGNPSSMHRKGVDAENEIIKAKKTIARLIKAQDKEIYFTSGGTESNNMALIGAAMANKRRGMHIITTGVEHASVSNPLKYLEENGFEITRLPVDSFGVISVDDLKAALRPDTVLVSIMYVNNEIGAVQPVEEAGAAIKAFDPAIVYHIDAIQAFGKYRIDCRKLKCDLLSVSGHKIHGPKGSGFIYIKDRTKVAPLILGGGQQKGMRSGTENVPAIAGLGVASEEIYKGFEAKIDHLYELRDAFVSDLLTIPGISVNGKSGRETAPHIVSISVEGVRAEVLLHALEDRQIYVSAGSACSSNKPSVSATLKGIGLPQNLLDSTIRVSFCVNTTKEELDYCISVMREIIPMLQKFTRK